MNEIIEGNQTVADFIGKQFINNMTFLARYPKDFLVASDCYKCFHNSLDWSIPVLEKIEKMGYQTDILNRVMPHLPGQAKKERRDDTVIIWDDCRTYLVVEVNALNKPEAVFKAILAFIKWLNQQKKKEDAKEN